MKYLILALLTQTMLMLISLGYVYASDDEMLEQYMTQCNAPAALYDPEVMASTLAEPYKFLQLLEIMSAPATTMTVYECIANEEQRQTVIKTMSDPDKLAASMSTFMSPQMYMNWMTAMQNPETQQALTTYMNPGHIRQWMSSVFELGAQHYSLKNN
jgi:hypothetical protein